jgi:hypothetical protein
MASPQQHAMHVQDLFLESGKYMRDTILKDFPPEFRATTKQSNVSETYDIMTRPDLDKHVFMRVLEDRGAVELDADGWACPHSQVLYYRSCIKLHVHIGELRCC